MSAELEREHPAPPVSEEIHLPGPTALPVICAAGITFIVIGTTLSWFISIFGGILVIVTVARWIADTRRDIDELPPQHGAGH